MRIQETLNLFPGTKKIHSNDHYTVLCPCHDDHKPSLDIKKGEKGIVMSCPVCGADGKRVMQELGLDVKELFDDSKRNNSTDYPFANKKNQHDSDRKKKPLDFDYNAKKAEAVYRYTPDLVKFRFPEKNMLWVHRKDGEWFWGRKGIKPPLYRQDLIKTALEKGAFLYIVEGEKDCNTVYQKLKCLAVSVPDGAGNNKWNPEHNKLFAGVNAVIIPDNDIPGRDFANLIAAQIKPYAASVRILDLRREWDWLKEKGDITDVYEGEKPLPDMSIADTVRTKLEALTISTEEYVITETSDPPLINLSDSENLSEGGYGCGGSPPNWTYESGDSRKLNEQLYITEFIKTHNVKCINNRLYSVDGAIEDGRARQIIIKEILPYVKTNHGDKADKLLKGIKALCYTEPPEPSIEKLHFKNGTLSRDSSGLFTVFSEEKEFCLNRFPINYNQNAKAPERFKKYLSEVYHEDDALTLQQYCGYCLLPTTIMQKALIIIGEGGEGKSVLGSILNQIIGESNCYNESVGILQTTFGIANVEGKLVFIDDDLSENALKNARAFKNLVTNKTTIAAQKKFVQDNQIKSFVRFICFGNFTLQALYDISEGFHRRQLIMQAKPKAENRVDNPFLDREIVDNEAEGIMMWLVNGLNELIRNNYQIYLSDRTKETSDSFKRENDSVYMFLTECDGITIGQGLKAHSSALVIAYQKFCGDNALTPLKERSFLAALKSKGKQFGITKPDYPFELPRESGKKSARGFEGISVKDSYFYL